MSNENLRSIRNVVKAGALSAGALTAAEVVFQYDYSTNQARIEELKRTSEAVMAIMGHNLPTILYMEGGIFSKLAVAGAVGLASLIVSHKHNNRNI